MTDLCVVFDAPPLLAGLLAQEIGDLATIPCPTCEGTGQAYATRFAGRKSTCRECLGEKTIQVSAASIEPRPDRCRLCKGRGRIESVQGFDVSCFVCDGCGDEPDPGEDPHDPRICVDCDHSHGAPCPVNPDGVCLYPDCPCVESVDPADYLKEHLQ